MEAGARRCGAWRGYAQVAEWLMAADCKSAAPCELRRFESSPVHQDFAFTLSVRELRLSRFTIAMLAYVVLGILAVATLDQTVPVAGRQVPLSAITLVVLGMFAFRTWLHHKSRLLAGESERGAAAETLSERSEPKGRRAI